VWSATLAEEPEDFIALIAPTYRWLNETETRVPMNDWYWTHDGKMAGFQARSVVGGVFVKLLADGELRWKWSARPGSLGTESVAASSGAPSS
jgi:hypothetical protein